MPRLSPFISAIDLFVGTRVYTPHGSWLSEADARKVVEASRQSSIETYRA